MPERNLESRVFWCGGITVILFLVAGTLSQVRSFPEWILISTVLLAVVFFLLAVGFLVQDARLSDPNTPTSNDAIEGIFGRWMLKCRRYWQCVLRVGIPFMLLIQGINYVEFRVAARTPGAKYPFFLFFPSELIVDVCIVLFVSSVFWWLARRLAALSLKSTER